MFLPLEWDRPVTSRSDIPSKLGPKRWDSSLLALFPDRCLMIPELTQKSSHLVVDMLEGSHRETTQRQKNRPKEDQSFQPPTFESSIWGPKRSIPSLTFLAAQSVNRIKILLCYKFWGDLLCHPSNWNMLYASWAGRRLVSEQINKIWSNMFYKEHGWLILLEIGEWWPQTG